jgi:hypothetical protein
MVFTRPQARAAFTHVLDNVIGKDDSSPLKQSLVAQGIEDVFHLCSMDTNDIDFLVYDKSDTELDVDVNRADKSLLRAFIAYVDNFEERGIPLSEINQWLSLQQNGFDVFRIGPHYNPLTGQSNLNNPGSPATTRGHAAHQFTPAEYFRRGIKRDPSLFPILKEEKFNDTWHRTFIDQARAQDVMQVLDPVYKPTSLDEIDLFNEKQKYVYAILGQKVLTDRGKAIVRNHEHDYDAQKVYQELKDHHLKSTKAMIDSSAILSYIT